MYQILIQKCRRTVKNNVNNIQIYDRFGRFQKCRICAITKNSYTAVMNQFRQSKSLDFWPSEFAGC